MSKMLFPRNLLLAQGFLLCLNWSAVICINPKWPPISEFFPGHALSQKEKKKKKKKKNTYIPFSIITFQRDLHV